MLLCARTGWADTTNQTAQTIPPAETVIAVGQRWDFHGRWLGIPVGYGWLEVTERLTLDGRDAFHLEAHGRTNEVLSKIYPVYDVVHSYVDAKTLQPLRFEKMQREGHYRSDEVVTFDHARSVATYHSRLSGDTWELPIPETFYDLLSVLIWFRAQPLQPGVPISVNIYTDEKIYDTKILVEEPEELELLKRGTFRCIVVEPKAAFKGLMVKRGRIWAYLTTDQHRLPLLVKLTTPWGPMTFVLEERSIPKDVLAAGHADRRAADP